MTKRELVMELFRKKESDLKTEDDREKYEDLKELLAFENHRIFSEMGVELGIGVLDFLGVEEDKILAFYMELVSEEVLDEIHSTYINIAKE